MARNPHLEQFHQDLRARYPLDGATMTYSQWLAANTRLGVRPFGFKGFEFQQAIVDDMHPDMAVIKCSQIGLTETQIRKFLAFLKRHRSTSGIFTFPDEKMFKKNSKTRIKPVVSQPVFNSTLNETKPSRSMELYEIDGSFAHILGMTEGDATSTPADILFHDELDLSDQAMIGLYQSRLQNSDFKITQRFSTPTHPGFGIDAAYQASDQRQYMVRCDGCGHWQAPGFEMGFLHLPGYAGDGKLDDLDADGVAGIDLDGCYVKCEHCSAKLDLWDPGKREWVAAYPARMGRGYRVSPFSPCHGRITVQYILQQLLRMKQLNQLKGWYNTVLGQTYSDGNSKLEPDKVKLIMRGPERVEVGSTVPVALGCDMGKTCHLVLGVPRGDDVDPFHFEQVPSEKIEDRIEQLLRSYNIVAGAVDRHPYTPTADRIRILSRGVVLPVEYRGAPLVNLVHDEYDNLNFVQINRTAAIDAVVKAVLNRSFEMRGYGGLASVLIEHMCDMVRIETDEKPATWEKTTGADHFMHSLVMLKASVKIRNIILAQSETELRTLVGLLGVRTAPLATLGQLPGKGRRLERVI
jgi:hypothetical protein